MTKFLEIVVPTYNRANILHQTLLEIASAIVPYSEYITLRVIDNCSEDDTQDVVTKVQQLYSFTYDRNPANIGLICNIAKCLTTSKAKWVWLFGDDDHVIHSAIPYLLKTLIVLQSDVVFARARALIADNGVIVHHEPVDEALRKKAFHLYEPGILISEGRSLHTLSFISNLVVQVRHWDQKLFHSIYKETDLYTFMNVLLTKAVTLPVAELPIHIVSGTARGDRKYYTKIMCLSRLTEYVSYERLVCKSIGRKAFKRLFRRDRLKTFAWRLISAIKISTTDELLIYKQEAVDNYVSEYMLETALIRLIGKLSRYRRLNLIMLKIYNSYKGSQCLE